MGGGGGGEQKQWDETLVLVLAGLTKVRWGGEREEGGEEGRKAGPCLQ